MTSLNSLSTLSIVAITESWKPGSWVIWDSSHPSKICFMLCLPRSSYCLPFDTEFLPTDPWGNQQHAFSGRLLVSRTSARHLCDVFLSMWHLCSLAIADWPSTCPALAFEWWGQMVTFLHILDAVLEDQCLYLAKSDCVGQESLCP